MLQTHLFISLGKSSTTTAAASVWTPRVDLFSRCSAQIPSTEIFFPSSLQASKTLSRLCHHISSVRSVLNNCSLSTRLSWLKSYIEEVTGVTFAEQRRPVVICVAADVRAVHLRILDRIRGRTCVDGLEKLPFPVGYDLLYSFTV